MKKKNDNLVLIILGIIFVAVFMNIFDDFKIDHNKKIFNDSKTLRILSSPDNSYAEDEIKKIAKENNIKINFEYMGDIAIVEELNNNSKDYDAVWISNSMWLYMLNNSYLTSDSKSLAISPIVFGIRKSKAKSLNLIGKNINNTDILNLIKNKEIKYLMSSVTQTNTGATAYLGFVSSLAGNPEVLTEEMLNNPLLLNNLRNVFSGVERVSGDESYLEEMFINNNEYEAVLASESSLININKALKSKGKEELYLIYPSDGVAINDSTFAFINNNKDKEEKFLTIQNYLLSSDGQKMLGDNGLRTWYGGTTNKSDSNTFNPDWGIDTTKYLNVTKYPSKNIITKALNVYIEDLRKPTHVVFCLDYSGSMYGDGNEQLVDAMDYILDYDKASKDKLQFSKGDKITVITFSSKVEDIWSSTGQDTNKLINNIKRKDVGTSTALYDAIVAGLNVLNNESEEYTKTIIAMTDGEINVGTYSGLEKKYGKSNIPIYSITFGDASESQLRKIAELSNAKVFNGKKDLLAAFKEVRGYN